MKYIRTDPRFLGGMPVVAGTRVPIARILFLLKEGMSLSDIEERYPHVPLTKLQAVIAELADSLGEGRHGTQLL